MASVGERLRQARLERGLDRNAVAALIKINAKYLQAIEADERHSLPSGFFYKSFVHQYAKTLGLDTEFIDHEVDALLSLDAPLPLPGHESAVSRSVPPVTSRPKFRSLRTLASVGALAVVLVGCSGVYLWWHAARAKPAGDQQARKQAAPPGGAGQRAASDSRSLAVVTKAPTTEPRAMHQFEAIPGYKVFVDLIAKEVTWLSVSSDGRPVFSGTLAPNQSKTVEGKQFAKVKVGNAAGLEIRLNGKFLGPLGGRGQVLTVIFTPDNFQILMPPSPRQGDDD